jgi:PAS domain S-box-containing protein
MTHARPQSILDSVPVGGVCLDREARITFANPVAARLLGFSVVEDLLDQPILTYIQFARSSAAAERATDGAGLALAGITVLPQGEESCWRGDGTSFPIEYESAPTIEDGVLVGVVITFRDISQRRSAERLKDELISVTSHELRSPLTSIRSALGLLAGGHIGQVPAKGQRMLEIAVTNTDRLIRLINDILDLERVNAGQVSMISVACDVGELMVQAADGVRSMAEELGVTIDVQPSDAQVWGDPDRLLQVLTNLLANAIKFSPPAGGTVWLDAERSESELVLRVRDEGRGIPAPKLEAIFDRFVQVEHGDAREKGGSGLGLAISRGIVKQHGGQIWAESTLGAGTTLCVALPLHEAVAPYWLETRDNSLNAA